jgi:hypothetical protein
MLKAWPGCSLGTSTGAMASRLDDADNAFTRSARDPDGSITWGSYDRGQEIWWGVLGRGWVRWIAGAFALAVVALLLVWLL